MLDGIIFRLQTILDEANTAVRMAQSGKVKNLKSLVRLQQAATGTLERFKRMQRADAVLARTASRVTTPAS